MVGKAFLAAVASCVACSSAFVVPGAMPMRRSVARMVAADDDRSTALPYDARPPALDGTLPGDAGFDPVGFSSSPPKPWLYGGQGNSLKWYRESELVHGRVAMLAVLGWIFPYLYHFPGNEAVSDTHTPAHARGSCVRMSDAPWRTCLMAYLHVCTVVACGSDALLPPPHRSASMPSPAPTPCRL